MNQAPPPDIKRPVVGPALFAVTLAAVLIFFWWLLLYDHGLPPAS